MKPEQQRIAIAEACGWTQIESCTCCDGVSRGYQPTPGAHKKHLPDYLNDLNAMHEAEKVLTYEQAEEFVEQLYLADQKNNLAENPPPWRFNVASATAAQRAEAFLRTIGKWEDDK
jgi:hypothetical protein